MKKIIYIFVILISFLVFNDAYTSFSNAQYTKLVNFPFALADQDKQSVLSVFFNLGSTKEERMEVFQKLTDFIESQEDIVITLNGIQENNVNKNQRIYIYSKLKLNNSFFHTIAGKEIDFSTYTPDYLSSKTSDTKCYDYIDFINKNYAKDYQDTIQIKQFSTYIEDVNTVMEIPLYFVTNDKASTYKKLKTVFDDKVKVTDEVNENESMHFPEMDTSFTNMVIIISFFAMLLLLACNVIKCKKEITIRKMHGATNFFILKQMILKSLLFYTLSFITTLLLLYTIKIGNLRPTNYELILFFIHYCIVFFAFIILVGILIYFIICKTTSYQFMKKKGNAQFVAYVSLCVKIGFITLVLSPFLTMIVQSKDIMKEAIILKNNESKMNAYIHIKSISMNNINKGIDESLALVRQYFNEHGGIYQDFYQNANEEMLAQIYPEFIAQYTFPYVIVNKNYLSDYNVKTVDNQVLNVENLGDFTLLVPNNYEEFDTAPYCQHHACQIVKIKNNETFVNHQSFTYDTKNLLSKKDPIILVRNTIDDTMNWNGDYMFLKEIDKTTVQDLESFLKEHNMQDTIYLGNISQSYQMATQKNNDLLLNSIFILILYITLTIIFQYQGIFIYYAEHKSEFAIHYLVGKNYLQRYAGLLTLNMLTYVIPLIYGYVMLHIPAIQLTCFLIIAILFDFMIAMIMTKYYEKKYIISILKGDNE